MFRPLNDPALVPLSTSRAILWGVLYGLAGFAANWFKLELFYGTDFIFGSFFVMLAVGRFGVVAGVIAGFIASSCTYLHWHHPWAIVVFTVEAAVVGWLCARRGKDLVFADILFWFAVGIPFSWALHRFALHMTPEQASFIFAKQAVNGIFNTLLASVLLLVVRVRSSREATSPAGAPPLRSILFNVLLALLLVPVIVLLVVEIRLNIGAEELSMTRRVDFTASSARDLVAARFGNLTSAAVSGHALTAHELEGLGDYLSLFAGQRKVHATVLDGNSRIVISSMSSRKTGAGFDLHQGAVWSELQNGVSLVSPKPLPGESALQSRMKSFYLKQVPIGPRSNWSILIESPVSEFFVIARHKGFNRFALALSLVVVASIVSLWLSRTLATPLMAVAELTTALPQKLIDKGGVVLPRAGFREMEVLSRNIAQMADTLSGYLEKLTEANETLEQRVVDRTREIVRLNEELARVLAERTEERDFSNRELEAFCYSISHELRAPIARLQGFCEAIREECPTDGDSTLDFYLKRITVASHQLRHVVDAILLLSRLSKTEISNERVNLSDLAEQIASEYVLAEHPRRLVFKIEPGLEACGDRQLLTICLENLLGNAVKYTTRTAEPLIEFGKELLDGGEAYYVRDNGAGFNMAFVEKLFKPFLRLHAESEFPGTGIGLVTVARIIERHGGRVWAEGKEGDGATFWFTIPPP